jgi:hypothetical protein
MSTSRRSPHLFIFAITMLVAFSSPSPAQVKVLISGGFSAAYQELLPQFEKSTGITVATARGESQGAGPTTIGAQLRRGQPADDDVALLNAGPGSDKCFRSSWIFVADRLLARNVAQYRKEVRAPFSSGLENDIARFRQPGAVRCLTPT